MVNKLDKVFGAREQYDPTLGPRLHRDELMAKALQSGSRWSCEESIKTTLDAFFECWPDWEPTSRKVMKEHEQACRDVVNEVGEMEAPAFIRWSYTIHVHESQSLTVKNARSLMFLVPRWRARESGPEWYRKPCSKCSTIHPPGTCPEDLEDEDE